MLTFESHRAG